ncbi:MAG: hypothetical protein O3B13_22205 [Planctomycetota bacterium]|nr:hypothetical protein [Planctomycetota bacterium]
MYNTKNLKRDLIATTVIAGFGLIMIAGGAVSSEPEVDAAPIHAGATLDTQSAKDVFDEGARETEELEWAEPEPTEPDSTVDAPETEVAEIQIELPPMEATEEPGAAESEETADTVTTPESEKVDDSEQPKPKADSKEKPKADRRAKNPVEQEKPPLNKLTEAEIKERLTKYRTWVHAGQINIEVDMTSLNAEQVAFLVDYYVLKTEQFNFRLEHSGESKVLSAIPEGRLITDLKLEKHWPRDTRKTAAQWIGNGPRLLNLAVVLNDRAELHLYRILVDSVDGEYPKPGTAIVIGITSDDHQILNFKVINITPPQAG